MMLIPLHEATSHQAFVAMQPILLFPTYQTHSKIKHLAQH